MPPGVIQDSDRNNPNKKDEAMTIPQSGLVTLAQKTESLAADARAANQYEEAERLAAAAVRYRQQDLASRAQQARDHRELYPEFDRRHGGNAVDIGTGWLVWPDGARATASDPEGYRLEPPDEPVERLKLQRAYHATAADRAQRDFSRVQGHFASQQDMAIRWENSVPGAPVDAPERLERIAVVVRHHRAELAKIVAELESSPQVQERREARAHEASLQASRGQLASAVASVHI
jgi:hypothetical protein